jgi:uncharacterized protein (DUF488 family)
VPEALPILTIGHSTRSIADFVDLLRHGGGSMVVDVRTVPKSRHNPQYNEEVLGAELARYQIGYVRVAGLGGLRGRSSDIPPELNGFWENQSFHNYADYALSDQFAEALGELITLGASRSCAIMCAEAVWWRCHRRIIADYLIARGISVFHLMGSDRVDEANMTPAAEVHGPTIVYPAVSL